MLPSRKIIAAFVGVFLIGTLVGGLVTWDLSDMKLSRFLNRTSDPESMAARINKKYADDYHLSPEEQAKIAPLTKEMAEHLYQARRQFGTDIISTLDDYHQKIGELMTPEHRAAYEQANLERKKRMNALLLPDPVAPAQEQK